MKIILEHLPHSRFTRIVKYAEDKYYRPYNSEKVHSIIEISRCEVTKGTRPLVYKSVEIEVADTTGWDSADDPIKKSTRGLMNIIMNRSSR